MSGCPILEIGPNLQAVILAFVAASAAAWAAYQTRVANAAVQELARLLQSEGKK